MDVSYLSTAEKDKFDTAIIEFLAEEDERSGKKRGKLRRYRELDTLVEGAPEPIGTGGRRNKNSMGLCLLYVAPGRLFDVVKRRRMWGGYRGFWEFAG